MIRSLTRIALLIVICVAVSTSTAAAQNPAARMAIPGLDMSKAPKDIQAIWKKITSGGIPTAAEAQRLSAWMQAHRNEMVQQAKSSATARASAMSSALGGAPSGGAAGSGASGLMPGGTANLPACPARSAVLTHLSATAPTRAAALALLDTLRTHYAAQEKPAAVQRLHASLARIGSAADLSQMGAALYLGGYDAPTVLTYVEAVRRANGATAQRAWGDLGAALAGIQDAHAVPVLRYALSLGPRSPLLAHNLGVAYADLGDLKTAATLLTEVTRTAPHFGGGFDALARIESCAGNMTLAWHAMAQAQEVDWTSDREQQLEKHNASKTPSDDDANADEATEAAKPIPTPPGPSPFPPPPNYHGASSFQPQTPAIPDDPKEAVAHQHYFALVAASYTNLARATQDAAYRAPAGPSAGERAAAQGAANAARHGMTIIVPLSNAHEALNGEDLVWRRVMARRTMIQQDFLSKDIGDAERVSAALAGVQRNLLACRKASNGHGEDCLPPYCKAKRAAMWGAAEGHRGAVRVYIGGLTGLAVKFNAAMMQWFAWAGDPKIRRIIDRQRIVGLATMEADEFTAASTVGNADLYEGQCAMEVADATGQRSALDANDPGACTAGSINTLVLMITEDCKQLSIVLTPLVIGGPQGRVDYHAASSSRSGTMFATLGAGIGPGGNLNIAEGHAGFGMTFDQSGAVNGFGPAAGGGIGSARFTGRLSGTGMINVLNSGPAVAGESHATPPLWMSIAGSPHFGGKMF